MDFILFANNHELYSSKRLLQEASNLGHTTSQLAPNNTLFDFDDKNDHSNTLFFHRSTGMLYDDFDLLISEQYEKAGARVVNDTSVMRTLRDKALQSQFFRKYNIPMIPTLSMRGRPTQEHIEKIKLLGNSNSFIVKTVRGNQGIGVNLINGEQSLKSLLETFWALGDQRFIIQPYLETEREYRILFCAGKILGIVEKTGGQGDFRKNSRLVPANVITETQLSNEVMELAHKAYQSSNAFIAGVDIISTPNGHFLLELNLVPGFKQMEELTNINIAYEFINCSMEAK